MFLSTYDLLNFQHKLIKTKLSMSTIERIQTNPLKSAFSDLQSYKIK